MSEEYRSQRPDELTLHVGDRVVVLGPAQGLPGWSEGQLVEGRNLGIFPNRVVKFIKENLPAARVHILKFLLVFRFLIKVKIIKMKCL